MPYETTDIACFDTGEIHEVHEVHEVIIDETCARAHSSRGIEANGFASGMMDPVWGLPRLRLGQSNKVAKVNFSFKGATLLAFAFLHEPLA